MNLLDWICIFPCIGLLYMGYKRGLIMAVFGFMATILGLLATLFFSHTIIVSVPFFQNMDQRVATLLVYIIVFLVVSKFVQLTGKGLESLLKITQLNFLNRVAGMGFGLLKAVLLLSAFFWLIDISNVLPKNIKSESFFYTNIRNFTPQLYAYIGEAIPWVKDLLKSIESYFYELKKHIDSAH